MNKKRDYTNILTPIQKDAKDNDKTVLTSLYLPACLLEDLKVLARKRRTTVNYIIRSMVLEKYGKLNEE